MFRLVWMPHDETSIKQEEEGYLEHCDSARGNPSSFLLTFSASSSTLTTWQLQGRAGGGGGRDGDSVNQLRYPHTETALCRNGPLPKRSCVEVAKLKRFSAAQEQPRNSQEQPRSNQSQQPATSGEGNYKISTIYIYKITYKITINNFSLQIITHPLI